jgi:2-polyprenyl-3-methyl-5-hydroxy-6-metoxy-1,4-benzoquinol methylase
MTPGVSDLTLRKAGCPICASFDSSPMGKPGRIDAAFTRFRQVIDAVEVVRCSNCSAMYISPMVHFSDSLQREIYNINYFKSNDGVEDLKNIGEKRNILRIVKRLSPGRLEGKTLLDIGCGTGEYLKTGLEFGLIVTGIDIDPSITEYTRRKYPVNVVTGQFGRDSFPPESFDVIVLSHVIEHLQRPKEMLANIHFALKTGGLLVMCTPNADSLMEDLHDMYGRFRRDRSKCYRLTAFISPYHILGFNREASKRILQAAGFENLYCELQSGLAVAQGNRNPIMLCTKVLGAVLGKGMSILTVSRKP